LQGVDEVLNDGGDVVRGSSTVLLAKETIEDKSSKKETGAVARRAEDVT
jgi:hypothetical protein